MNDQPGNNKPGNDKESPAFRAALAALTADAVTGAPHLRLVWSALLRPVGECSPWERLHDRLLWLDVIAWLWQDVQNEQDEQAGPQ